MSAKRPHVVIVGGGFAGLAAARGLRRAPVHVTLIDRQNHHLFQPLLYQVATAGLGATEIARPIRDIVRGQENLTVLLGAVRAVRPASRELDWAGGTFSYDRLIVATGASHAYFGNDHWSVHAPGLKSLDDAREIRDRVLLAWELAERSDDETERARLLTFVVVGAGPTGVELAGALAEIAKHTMTRNFRRFDPRTARIILLEAGDRVLSTFDTALSVHAQAQLERLGVIVRTNARVTDIDEDGVSLGEERIRAATVLWAAGVRGSSLGRSLGAQLDWHGRVAVDARLSVPDHPEIMVLGDLAAVQNASGEQIPAVAPAALQMGRYAAARIRRELNDREAPPFRYIDKGSMATIGRSKAVAQSGPLRMRGFIAWLAWAFIHVLYLVGFRNRFIVLADWIISWFSYRRGARLISTAASNFGPGISQRAAGANRTGFDSGAMLAPTTDDFEEVDQHLRASPRRVSIDKEIDGLPHDRVREDSIEQPARDNPNP